MSSIATWKERLQGKSPLQAADLILNSLHGYRKTSLKRAEDADNIVNALQALINLEKEETVTRTE